MADSPYVHWETAGAGFTTTTDAAHREFIRTAFFDAQVTPDMADAISHG